MCVDGASARFLLLRQQSESFAQRLALALMLDAEGLSHDAMLVMSGLAAKRPSEPALEPWRR